MNIRARLVTEAKYFDILTHSKNLSSFIFSIPHGRLFYSFAQACCNEYRLEYI